MNKDFFIENRKNIINLMNNNSVMIINSGPHNDDSIFNDKYDESRNYYYSCGLFEYGNIIVLVKDNDNIIERIYIKRLDLELAKWVGRPLTKEEVYDISGIKDIRYIDSFKNDINELLIKSKYLYLDTAQDINPYIRSEKELAFRYKKLYPDIEILASTTIFKKLRTVKREVEIEKMQKAINITKLGIENILKNIGEMYEYQLESYFDFIVKYNGATGYAFPTIAASGKNAVSLHYMENNSLAKNGDLILFDLGASYDMYCADISRTFPISGKFTNRQRELYNIVLNGQKAVLDFARPGLTTKDLNNHLIQYYQKELKRIRLIKKDYEVNKYYYHGVSHHIGLDCHDLCEYDGLRKNSIISNEPGLYIEEEGIGIRIEDDMIITANGAKLLSSDIIKEASDIESYIEKHKKH